ncbi:MAG: prepilin-type N-terminal cleavage/methylation domain-containing protein [bacterium]
MKPSNRAFTLIELLIVVAIIGILAAIAVPNFLNARMRTMVTRTYSDLKALHSAMEMYRIDNNAYVPDYDSGGVPGASASMNEYLTYSKLTTPVSYMASIPLDPYFIGSTAGAAHPKAVAYFQYAGPYGGRQDPRDAWRPSGTIYTMTSLGPDKVDQIGWSYPHDQAYAISYNLTNGLTSSGDIYMSNHGLIF